MVANISGVKKESKHAICQPSPQLKAQPIAQFIAQSCALTFQGNASNQLQQDAFYFLDNWYQEKLGVTDVNKVSDCFCLAVSDGVSSSNQSQYCSKAIVKAIARLRNDKQPITINAIHDVMSHAQHPIKRQGAAATLALFAGGLNEDGVIRGTIRHVGDSRVYRLAATDSQWRCLTRDHNVLNDLLDQQAQEKQSVVPFADYNRENMASSLYTLSEYFVLTPDDNHHNSEAPSGTIDTLTINSGDVYLLCTDGIHDLVSCEQWPLINAQTDLQQWLLDLKTQVYQSKGKAYDNGTAVVIRFD